MSAHTRRNFVGLLGAGAATGFGLLRSVAAAQPTQRPHNIIFILADDLGWADTDINADEALHETPNLVKLASQSVRFTNAYAAAPLCTPTRASIMTGKYPARLHMTITRERAATPPHNKRVVPPITLGDLPHKEVTIAEVLRPRGYLNAHIGKWHLGTAEFYPETQGFDANIGGTLWGASQSHFYPYSGTKYFGGEPRYVPHMEGGKPGEYLADRLTDEALRIIDGAAGRPFYVNLCYYSVHTPIEGKPDLVEHYQKKLRPEHKRRNAAYAAMVHNLDENVGRVLAKVDQLGLARDTVVIFTSDNGGFLGKFDGQPVTTNDPLRSGKGSLYEGGIRVPLLVRWSGASAGTTCVEPVISTDYLATLAEIAGAPAEPQDGVSLVPLLKKPQSKLSRNELFFHYPHYYDTTSPVSAVRARDWKLLEYLEDGRIELYNLANDPSEQRDLAAQMPERARELHQRLINWRTSVAAQMPSPQAGGAKSKNP